MITIDWVQLILLIAGAVGTWFYQRVQGPKPADPSRRPMLDAILQIIRELASRNQPTPSPVPSPAANQEQEALLKLLRELLSSRVTP